MLFLTPGWPKKKTHRHRSPFQARFCQWCQEASKARQKAAEAAQSQGVRVSQRSGLQPQFRVSCVSSWPGCMIASEMDVFFFLMGFRVPTENVVKKGIDIPKTFTRDVQKKVHF